MAYKEGTEAPTAIAMQQEIFQCHGRKRFTAFGTVFAQYSVGVDLQLCWGEKKLGFKTPN